MFTQFLKKLKVYLKNRFKGTPDKLAKISYKFWLSFALLLTIPSFISLLRPGYFPMQDDMQAFKIYEINECVNDFQIPCRWSQNSGYGYGEPVFNFYSPFVYYFGEIFHLAGFQIIDSVKLVFITGFLLSTISIFILTAELWGPFAGFVAGILFTYAPFRAQEVYVRGSMAEFFAVSIMPLILWNLYKVIKEAKLKYVLYLSLTLGILLLSHNLTTMMFAPFAFIWSLYFIITSKKYSSTKPLVIGTLLGLSLAAFFMLPMMIEKNSVHLESILTGYFDYRRHFLSFRQIFFSNAWGFGSSDLGDTDDLALNSGAVLLLSGFLAFVIGFLRRKSFKEYTSLLVILSGFELLILFLMHLKSEFLYRAFPFLVWLQFPWRFLSISILVLSILAAMFIHLSGKLKYFTGFIAVTLVFVLHSSFFRPVSWYDISDSDKFGGESWEKQLTISIFDYLPKTAILPPNRKSPNIPEVLEGSAQVKSYEVASYYQKGVVNVEEEAILRFPMIDYPGMELKVDGKEVNYSNNDCRGQDYCFGLVTAKISPGDHMTELRLTDTPVRKLGNYISLAGILVATYLSIKIRHDKNN